MPKLISKKSLVLYFLVSALVLLSLATYFKGKDSLVKESGEKEKISEVVTTPEPEIKEDIKDGVYTNYEYGFSFEYDDTIFNKISKDGTPTSSMQFLEQDALLPKISVYPFRYEFSDNEIAESLKTKQLSNGEFLYNKDFFISTEKSLWPDWNTQKVRDLTIDDKECMVYTSTDTGGGREDGMLLSSQVLECSVGGNNVIGVSMGS